MDDRLFYLAFSSFPGIGPAKFKLLLKNFQTAQKAWRASVSDLEKIGLKKPLAEKFDRFRNQFSLTEYVKKLKEKEVWYLTLADKDYPKRLSQIKNPPFILYGRGEPEILKQVQDDNKTIAVVGARKTTQYGREVTKLFTQELVANGFTIVSGLAIGVDAISHMTCLENGGKTIAVLGCGADCCYPVGNQSIYNSIVENGGCVVSEFPLQMKPSKWTFPARNRIIAGLSCAVLVTEGAEDSGSLITANYARKFGRHVFAVPGPITSSLSKGPYKLISKGAKLVTSGEDILIELKIHPERNRGTKFKSITQNLKVRSATREEQKILNLLENEQLHFDEIVRKSRLSSSKIGSIISLMEIKGLIKSLDGGIFST